MITVTNRALQQLDSREGCTVHPRTCVYEGFKGFAVSKKHYCKPCAGFPTYEEIGKYLWDHHEAFNIAGKETPQPQLLFGCQRRGKWFLEQTYILQEWQDGNAHGIIERQDTIFDFEFDRGIKVVYAAMPDSDSLMQQVDDCLKTALVLE